MGIYQRLWYTPKREKVFKERSPRHKRSHLNSTKVYRISRQLTINACLIKLLPKQDFFLHLSFDCGYIVLWYVLQLKQWAYIILRDQSWVSNLSACISESFQDKQSTRVTREHWGHDHLAKGQGKDEPRTWRVDTQKFNSAPSTFQLMKDLCYTSLSDAHAQFHLHGVFNVPIGNNGISLSYKPTSPRLLLDFRCVKQKWELLKLYFVENED